MLALICGMITLWGLFTISKVLWLNWKSYEWKEAKAWVESITLQDPVGRYLSEQSIKCKYRYSYADREYHGQTIALLQGNDTWKVEWFMRLTSKYERHEPIVCYVDPTKPTRAILTRSWSKNRLLIIVSFVLVSVGYVVCWCVYVRRNSKRKQI